LVLFSEGAGGGEGVRGYLISERIWFLRQKFWPILWHLNCSRKCTSVLLKHYSYIRTDFVANYSSVRSYTN
jgi:hypothetical protein